MPIVLAPSVVASLSSRLRVDFHGPSKHTGRFRGLPFALLRETDRRVFRVTQVMS